MFEHLKQRWQRFAAIPAGSRFKEQFQQRQSHRPSAWHKKILAIGSGILIMGVGLVMLIAPGPGLLVLLVGAGLIAQESYVAARAMDWLDLRLQPVFAWAMRVWQRYRKH